MIGRLLLLLTKLIKADLNGTEITLDTITLNIETSKTTKYTINKSKYLYFLKFKSPTTEYIMSVITHLHIME